MFIPATKIFDEYIIDLPPIALGLDGGKIVFPYTETLPWYLSPEGIEDADEADP